MNKSRKVFGRSKLFTGIAFIAAAVVILLNSLFGDIPVVSLIVAVFAATWMASELIKGKLSNIFIPAGIIFIALQGHISRWIGHGGDNFISPWIVILSALLLQIGVKILMPHGKRWGNSHLSHNVAGCTSSNDNYFGNELGASTCYVDASTLGSFNVTNELGHLDVYIENPEKYEGGGTLTVTNELGQTVIHIPAGWGVINNIVVELGVVECSVPTDKSPVLTIVGSCELGNVKIV